MMRLKFLIPVTAILGVACAHGPLKVTEERRFTDTYWAGLSTRIVTGAGLSTDGTNLYFGTRRGTLYAVSGATGKTIWKVRLAGAVDSRPLVQGKKIFVGTSEGKLYCLEASDGKEKWSAQLGGDVLGQPVPVGDRIVLAGANDGFLYALDAETGEQKWRSRRDLPDRITIQSFSTPAVGGGRIFSGFADGTVAALRAEDGVEVWSQKLKGEGRFPDVVAPLLLASDRLVAAQFDGSLYAFDASGNTLWSVPGAGTSAPSVLSEDLLLVPAAGNRVLDLAAGTGEKRWEFHAPEAATWSGIALERGRILATSFEGFLYVLERKTGRFVWKYRLGAPIQGSPVLAGGNAWALTQKGALFRLVFGETGGAVL